MYDGLLIHNTTVEVAGVAALDGAIVKEHVRWSDNFFMRMRDAGVDTPEPIVKIAGVTKCCIPNALANVASLKTRTSVARNWRKSGPHSYGDLMRFLVSTKTGSFIKASSLTDVINAAPGQSFLLHFDGHAAGITMTMDGGWRVADDTYNTWTAIGAEDLRTLIDGFKDMTQGVVIWSVHTGVRRSGNSESI